MDAKIEQYLEDIAFLIPPDTYKAMFADANTLDTKSWLNKYQNMAQQDETLAATWSDYGFDSYSKDKWERIRDTFGSSDSENPFDKPEAWLKTQWAKNYQDMSFEDFKNDVSTMSKYWEDEKRAREYNAGKKTREREVKNWPLWKDVLASDYAKQRYINEPEKSIFSDEGEWYNKGEDISDLLYGGAGAVADVIPGYGAFLGPAVRASRDIQHKVTDSPYQKEWSDIGQDALSDAAVNAGVEFMPTALLNRGRKFGKNIGKSDELFTDLGAEINVAQRQKANDAAFEYLKKNVDMFDDARVAQIRVNSMPESDIKNDMLKLVNSDTYSKAQLLRYMDAYETASKEGIDAYKYWPNTSNTRPNKNIKTDNLGESSVDYFKSKERLQGLPESKIRSSVAKVMTNYMPAGQTIVKEIDTAKGRGSEPAVDDKLTKDWYKQNYERDWQMGFKPNEKEGDLLWEAYKEWKEGK